MSNNISTSWISHRCRLVWRRRERDQESKSKRRRTETRKYSVSEDVLPSTRQRRPPKPKDENFTTLSLDECIICLLLFCWASQTKKPTLKSWFLTKMQSKKWENLWKTQLAHNKSSAAELCSEQSIAADQSNDVNVRNVLIHQVIEVQRKRCGHA